MNAALLSDGVTSVNEDKFKILGFVTAYSGDAFLDLLLRIRVVTFK